MRAKTSVSIARVVTLLLAAGLLASCVTHSGSTLKTVSPVESHTSDKPADKGSAKPAAKPPTKPPAELPAEGKKGLEVVSTPSNAEVILDNEHRGRTPLLIASIGDGRHLLVLQKAGYYTVSRWIDYSGDYMLYEATLLPITGFLSLTISPAESTVTVGDGRILPGFSEMPVGSYSVLARAFGYADYKGSISILERSLTPLDIVLSPVPFDFTRFLAVRSVVNPDNPGVLGSIELVLSVTGPGEGTLTVLDSSSQPVFTDRLPRFTTWDQSYRWSCSDSEGRDLPDGAYTIVLAGEGTGEADQPEAEATRQIEVRIDRSVRVAPRSLWSGGAGLLYAPSADVLPAGAFQSTLLAASFLDAASFRSPVALGVRIGLSGGVELDFLGDLVLSDAEAPFGVGVSARYLLAAPQGSVGFGAALQGKVSIQYDPAAGVLLSDTFANFTGISLGLPLQVTAGPVSLLAGFDLVASLWEPYASTRDPRVAAWVYLRAGLLLDFGQVVGGLSVSARTTPLFVDPFGIGLPVLAGAEVQWLIPGSHLVLSGMLAAEASGLADLDLMAGGGLGFLY